MGFESEKRKGCLHSLKRASWFSAALMLISIVAACCATLPIVKAQTLSFEKTWGGSSIDDGRGVAVDSSGIYVTGYTWSFGAGDCDVFLLKFDVSGNLLWQRTWGGSSEDVGRGVAVDSSGIYVAGETNNVGAGKYDVVLLKFDVSGNLLWQRTWGGSLDDDGWAVAVDSSGIYVTGFTMSFGAGDYDVLLLKFDSSGSLLWQKTWGGTGYDEGLGVAVGSSYFTGDTNSASRTFSDVSGTVGTPTFTLGTPAFSLGTPAFSLGTPTFVLGTPSGSETYAGSADVFLLKVGPAPRPVGGVLVPVNKLSILAPYLALVGLVGAVAAIGLRRRRNS